MKTNRLFLIFACLLFACTVFSQRMECKADSFDIRKPGQQWGGWQTSDVEIVFDYTHKTIWFNSELEQTMTYEDVEVTPFSDGQDFMFLCKSNTNAKCGVELVQYNDGDVFVLVRYKNYEYIYKVHR